MKTQNQHSDKPNALPCVQTPVKCRFFAQYWGQEVLGSTHFKNIKAVMFNYDLFGSLNTAKGLISATEAFKTYFLWLKPLSKITDEHCILIFNNFFPNAIRYSDAEKIYDIKSFIKSNFSEDVIIDEDFIFYTDFMRSKGYALPFMKYSVDDLVSLGWLQLL